MSDHRPNPMAGQDSSPTAETEGPRPQRPQPKVKVPPQPINQDSGSSWALEAPDPVQMREQPGESTFSKRSQSPSPPIPQQSLEVTPTDPPTQKTSIYVLGGVAALSVVCASAIEVVAPGLSSFPTTLVGVALAALGALGVKRGQSQ